jgi:hypothetical protein
MEDLNFLPLRKITPTIIYLIIQLAFIYFYTYQIDSIFKKIT